MLGWFNANASPYCSSQLFFKYLPIVLINGGKRLIFHVERQTLVRDFVVVVNSRIDDVVYLLVNFSFPKMLANLRGIKYPYFASHTIERQLDICDVLTVK